MLKKTSNFAKLLKLMEGKDKIFAACAIIFTIFASICDLMNPFVFARILNAIPQENIPVSPNSIPWYLFGIMCGLSIFSLLFAILYTLFSVKLSINISTNLRLKLFSHIQYLSSKDIDNLTPSSLLTRVTSDVTNVQTFLLNTFSIAIKSICFVIGGFTLSIIQIATFDGNPIIWSMTSAYALIIIFLIIALLLVKKGMPIFHKTRQAMDVNNAIMSENIIGNKIIRAFNLEKKQAKKYQSGNDNLRKISIRAEGLFCVIMPLSFFVMNLATVFIITFAGVYVINSKPVSLAEIKKTMDLIGIVMSFIQYFMLIMVGMTLVGMYVFTLSRGKVSSNRIFEAIETEPLIKNNKSGKKMKKGNIDFKNVSFAYFEGKDVLKNINLSIKEGEWLGIIGQTGSGKSTLVNLITRLYDVQKGEVIVSDVNVKDLDLESLRDNISVSIQEKILLQGTMKSNILAGKQNATMSEIKQAASWAEAAEFIESKPNKYDARVEQRGSNLSGGQKQRISIARALIKRPKILIFDDSTSALDAITERKIINNLNKNFKGTTVIFVSQKVRSIQSCDQIIVLDDGKIVQHGKHNELMKDANGIYKKIYDSQAMSVEG